MSAKGEIYVSAILLPTGEVSYRMRDEEMAEALSHPDSRLGVMVLFGHYAEHRPIARKDPCPMCGHRGSGKSQSAWDFQQSRPPVFVCDDGVFVLEKRAPSPERRDYWGNVIVNPPEWWITDVREASAVIDKRKLRWIIEDWMERNA
jgi:hypothetical protein